jgi:hypothetical protein
MASGPLKIYLRMRATAERSADAAGLHARHLVAPLALGAEERVDAIIDDRARHAARLRPVVGSAQLRVNYNTAREIWNAVLDA